jgi:hypothetical protein
MHLDCSHFLWEHEMSPYLGVDKMLVDEMLCCRFKNLILRVSWQKT